MPVSYSSPQASIFKSLENAETETNSEFPVWVKKFISEKESQPVENPPASLMQCQYKNQTVYYASANCCDQFSVLYNKSGNAICAPDGGLTGKGDGKCRDFGETRENFKTIWKDARTRT